jgi:hypothetical protein
MVKIRAVLDADEFAVVRTGTRRQKGDGSQRGQPEEDG